MTQIWQQKPQSGLTLIHNPDNRQGINSMLTSHIHTYIQLKQLMY